MTNIFIKYFLSIYSYSQCCGKKLLPAITSRISIHHAFQIVNEKKQNE